MKLPRKWLCEYVDMTGISNEEFTEKMMWRGFEMASIDPELPDVEGVVVGHVEEIYRHENSDHLWVTKTNVGDEILTIVTGAQNVHQGDYVPVAKVGAKLSGHEMAPVNMRGITSYGMLCSGKELGITEAHYPGSSVDGIMILNEAHPLGQDIAEAVGMTDVIYNIELTPNRPDCASIIGICREAAAALGQKFIEPEIKTVSAEGNAADYASVTVKNDELCPRYCARVVTDIKIEPSPDWMQKKLLSVGLRPINNIVDITNYVLIEYGHPMHAFDLACITDGHIVVRNAEKGEVVTTLDDKERPVTEDMLLIADPVRGVGIAGVMGGLNSEITENTKVVLFEAAVFKGSNIRATARGLRHMTDAASRFIKGVEPVNAQLALDRAIELVVELGAGKVVGDTIDVCSADITPRKITVDPGHINRLLNLELTAEQMGQMLDTINIPAKAQADGSLAVEVPHFRTDIESGIEADWDIAEEIARIYGYNNIEATLMRGDTFRGGLGRPWKFEDDLKDTLVAQGLYEMYNFNFTGPNKLKALLLEEGDEKLQAVRILNPFGEDQSLMRTTLYMGMLESMERNLNRRTGQGRFFEVGNVHFDNNTKLPEERKMVGLMFTGETESFFTLKGVLEELFSCLNIKGVTYKALSRPYFQPGRAAQILAADGAVLGEMGDIHPDVANAFGINCRAYSAELSFQAMLDHADTEIRFEAMPRFPVVLRDLAVVTDRGTEASALANVIASAPTGLIVENVTLFDSYRGPGIQEGKKSLAFNFTLRAEDHTLSDEEIKGAMAAILSALEQAGASLRS
ncbi:MAG: phenylalanine--tRNA ligase subunit beta [Clostridia bacterium]|nr:phenylalanine--tRNA ligase subunit beta [Clostridia bacterium]